VKKKSGVFAARSVETIAKYIIVHADHSGEWNAESRAYLDDPENYLPHEPRINDKGLVSRKFVVYNPARYQQVGSKTLTWHYKLGLLAGDGSYS
jgi:hypothetical protein